MQILGLALTLLAGYFLGNINGAVIISKNFLKVDVRTKGSRNAGATNFFRNFGGRKSILVLLIDIAKTVLGCYLGAFVCKWCGLDDWWTVGKMLGGTAVILGHIFPVLLHFRGGKGILCSGTLALVMNPLIFLILIVIFATLFFTTHYVSLGSIVCACVFPFLFLWFFYRQWSIFAMSVAIAILSIFMHRGNLKRLKNGTETKTYLRKRDSTI